ncbi:MAG: DUF1028 domain-containing protein [Acidobacteria bacterium]|jgi:uncharacterized Ntn-hydrolase superfamily protein|nr:DUF1028 domain-containing protein [Acidobacteriota bacterium]
MDRLFCSIAAILVGTAVMAQASAPRAFTFSIVARDPATGEMGVAVQSHWFSVGSAVPWAEAGVGAVATQSFVDQSYGPLGLDLMRAGKSAPDALKSLLAGDDGREVRQVAMIDAKGRIAVHTGAKCIPAAGHEIGEQFSVEANLMENAKVWPAMAKAYREAKGDLAERMLAALDAAQSVGGDIRGMQSAAILVVKGQSTGKPWADTVFNLRVEDNPAPLQELRRLVRLQRAYNHASAGDDLTAAGKLDEALKEYAEAARLAPEVQELPYWEAVALASNGHLEESLPIFKAVFEKEPRWAELTPRLPGVDLLPKDPELLKKIMAQAADNKTQSKEHLSHH